MPTSDKPRRKQPERGATLSRDAKPDPNAVKVERVQTGLRIERRILKILKALAEYHDMTLGDLLEGIVLHAFEGKASLGADSLKQVKILRSVYSLDLTAEASHRLIE